MVRPNVKLGLCPEADLPIFLVVTELVSRLTELSWFLGFVPVVGSLWLLGIVDCCSEELVVVGMIFRGLEAEVFVIEKRPRTEELALPFDLDGKLVGCFVGFLVVIDVRNG